MLKSAVYFLFACCLVPLSLAQNAPRPPDAPPYVPPAADAPDPCAPSAYAADAFAPRPAWPTQTRAPAAPKSAPFDVEVLAAGLVRPYALAFLPDGGLLITERVGRMRIVKDGKVSAPLGGLPPVRAMPLTGLYEVLLDPGFATNRTLYFNYFAPPEGKQDEQMTAKAWLAWLALPAATRGDTPIGQARVASARLSADGTQLEDVKVILQGGINGRMVFARDGKLLITAGTPAGRDINTDDEPQHLENAYGKVLRINPDGSIPKDNPFLDRKNARPDIWTYGMRDPQGVAINPWTGDLWTSENGPRGGDEINIQKAGNNYGFPTISYGREYSQKPINGGLTAKAGMQQPVYFWTPSVAPSGITFYKGDLFPQWQGNLFVAALAGKKLMRLVLKDERVVGEEALLVERCSRIRNVKEAVDGSLYVLTDSTTDGQILRLTPVSRAGAN